MPEQISNQLLETRLITEPGEREYYSDVITRYHYLGSSQVNKNTIVHVSRRGKEDVGIMTWEPGVRRWFGMRDRLIGWTPDQQKQRLKYCVENRRFLMLVKEPNLASQVLSTSLKRLPEDGEKLYGHEFVLAETFVDPSQGYQGTCYKAAGWTDVGLTQGGRGKQERSQKKYFVKELKINAIGKLKAPDLTPTDTKNPRQQVLTLENIDLQGLIRKLDEVPDFRKHCGWYPMSGLLALILTAVLCGETNSKDIFRWIKDLSLILLKSLGFRKAPAYSTVWRVITHTDNAALTAAVTTWLTEHLEKVYGKERPYRILNFDGKALRGASKTAGKEIQVLTLIDSLAKVMINQKPVSDKTNEIPVAQKMLEQQNLDAQTIVTGDALHTQTKTAAIIAKKNHLTSLPSKIIKKISKKPSLLLQ